MIELQSGMAIDERFAKRFPDRQFWIRPATGGERAKLDMMRPRKGLYLCLAIAREGDKTYRKAPFWCASRDVADGSDDGAAAVFLKALEAINAGTVAVVFPYRSRRV